MHVTSPRSPVVRPSAAAPAGVPADPLLDLAGRLAAATTLTAQVDATLPFLSKELHTTVTVFAVAGSQAAGVRCWPPDPRWAAALRDTLGASWEAGELTRWHQRVGVVPATSVHDVTTGWGTRPGLVLQHAGRVLHELVVVPLSRSGTTVSAYLLARYEQPFDATELDRLRAVQAVLVASHGRFLRPPDPALTARQHSVLRLLAEGRTVKAIGSRLGISQSTVDKHVRDLYHRLGTQDRASTIRSAQVRGLLDGIVGEDWQDLLIAPAR